MTNKKIFIPVGLTNYIELPNGRKLYMTQHSERRLRERNISEAQIIEAFTNPDVVMPNADYINAKNYIKTFKNKMLKIGIKDEGEPLILITAFFR